MFIAGFILSEPTECYYCAGTTDCADPFDNSTSAICQMTNETSFPSFFDQFNLVDKQLENKRTGHVCATIIIDQVNGSDVLSIK